MRLATKLHAYWSLGPKSLARVGLYRAGIKTGLHPAQRLQTADPGKGPFFRAGHESGTGASNGRRTPRLLRYFDHYEEDLTAGDRPRWHANPYGHDLSEFAGLPWWRIPDFDHGDIKGLWETSRFGWLFSLAEAVRQGEGEAAETLNDWLGQWSLANPPYFGPNWKCGQEASIRVLHLAAIAIVLGESDRPLSGLLEILHQHLARVRPTIGYALGQDNNHATSEAAALFVGGNMLATAGVRCGQAWHELGRKLLEACAENLIMEDGSFSQYSVNYHRMMLDTYCFAELWRQRHRLPDFTPNLKRRLGAAAEWLRSMVDLQTGDAPNIGASDGTRLFPFHAASYRDFRPTAQMSSALFLGKRAYPSGAYDAAARLLGYSLPTDILPAPSSRTFDEGGWHVLRTRSACAVMRYPRFRFRPSHADALHVDLLARGRNLLRDAGTFSYNDPSTPDADFAATRFHNTVSFDGTDQMPRLSRFLFARWLRAEGVVPVSERGGWVRCSAGYRDRRGNGHLRHLALADDRMECIDELSGGFERAQLRWRLPPGDWDLRGGELTGRGLRIVVNADGAKPKASLLVGQEARHYRQLTSVTVLVVEVDRPCRIKSDIRF